MNEERSEIKMAHVEQFNQQNENDKTVLYRSSFCHFNDRMSDNKMNESSQPFYVGALSLKVIEVT